MTAVMLEMGNFPIADVVEVLAGDTLTDIAARCYGDVHEWPRIYKANRAAIDHRLGLAPGLRLIIPARPWP